jgi:hypothetical protein
VNPNLDALSTYAAFQMKRRIDDAAKKLLSCHAVLDKLAILYHFSQLMPSGNIGDICQMAIT